MSKKLILKASAGTGKTYRLSLEYIATLLQGIDFKEILVMTFTKKATGEIKERILKFLHEIVTNDEIKIEIENNLKNIYGDSFTINMKKASKIYENILENKDKLKIFTIDAFTNNIFKKAIAPYLKFYTYEIIDEEENRKILIKTFQKLFENREDFLLFKDFLEDNSEKNMDTYVNLIGRILNERWKMIILEKNGFQSKTPLSHENSQNILEKIISILQEVANIKGKTLEECLKTDFLPYLKDRENFLLENYSLFLNKDIWNGVKVRVKKGDIESQLEDLKYLTGELKENLAREMYNKYVIPYENKLLKIMTKIYEIYDDIKFREKRFTFNDISNYTFRYIQDTELGFIDEFGVTDEFFEIIDGKLKTIFIDEFQDTSILQWKILKNIIDRCENIICVGDEKQSIYGWRGGEKELFENLSSMIEEQEEILDTCFRSRENIVTYTNELFSEISSNSQDFLPPNYSWKFIPVNFKKRADKPDGRVELIYPKSDDEEILDRFIEILHQEFKDNYHGIGVLARTKKTLNEIALRLSLENIPYTLETDSSIFEDKKIFGVYSFINWLVKRDFLSFLEFLRSDLIKISAPLLQELIEKRELLENYFNKDWEGDTPFNENFKFLIPLKKLSDEYQLKNEETDFLTYSMLLSLGLIEESSGDDEGSTLFNFYKLLKEYRYFSEFLIDFEENPNSDKFKKISQDKNNSISLMTVHKSKGLEFDTTFYFLPTKDRNRNDKKLQFYIKLDSNYSISEDFLITNDKFNDILKNIQSIEWLKKEEIKKFQEEINNFYVALTRPKNNLFIVSNNINILEETIFSKLLGMKNRGELLVKKIENEEKTDKKDFAFSALVPHLKYEKSSEELNKIGNDKIFSHTLSLEMKRVRGTIVHYFLENILYWNSEEIELAKKLTFSKFASFIGEKEINELLSNKNLEYIFSKCSKIFEKNWDFIYREYPIYTTLNGKIKEYRLDRLMIKKPFDDKKGIVFIADYKTGQKDEEQMNNYKNLISNLLKNNKEINFEDYEIITEFIELDI